MLQFKCRKKYLPPGEHEVRLNSVEVAPSLFGEGKEALEFIFSNDNGEVVVKTGTTLRPPHALHDLAQKLLAVTIKPGDDVDLESCIGRRYRIKVSTTKTGAVSVDQIDALETEEEIQALMAKLT